MLRKVLKCPYEANQLIRSHVAKRTETGAKSPKAASRSPSDPMASSMDALTDELRSVDKRIATLMQEKAQLQKRLETAQPGGAKPMSAEVVDSNPYSRLMALKRMGVVANYERVRDLSVLIVGLGGIGSVAAEMLTRCGVGKLIMYDYDTVEIANMNRLFFRPEQAGMTKTAAAKQTLQSKTKRSLCERLNELTCVCVCVVTHSGINPDVIFEEYTMDITTTQNFDQLLDRIQHGGVNNASRVDLVLSCVDNYAARTTLNAACNELNQAWMESGVSEDAVSGHIQFLLPGRTACFECLPPLIVASGIDESTLKREGVCAASLPTTMGLVAALLVQNVLKYLLGFGQVSYYLGYSAMKDFFPSDVMRPNPECSNRHCRLQQAAPAHAGWTPMVWTALGHDGSPDVPVEHSENEWGIELGGGSSSGGALSGDVDHAGVAESVATLASGLSFAYEQPSASAEAVVADENADVSLEELMGQLKSM